MHQYLKNKKLLFVRVCVCVSERQRDRMNEEKRDPPSTTHSLQRTRLNNEEIESGPYIHELIFKMR